MNIIETEATIDAEQSVLGAVLLDPTALDEITFLEERDFESIRHQQILKVMRYLDHKEMPVDIVSIAEVCQKFGGVDRVGGVTYITNLASACPSAANVRFYANIVRSKAMERRVRNAGDIISGMSRDDYESDEEYFSFIERLVSDLRPQSNDKMQSVYQSKSEYMEHLTSSVGKIKTGFKEYDRWARGLWRGWLFVSAGRPSVGKTAMLLQRLYGVAQQNEGAVLLFSQEMDRNSIIDRWISSLTGITYSKIKDGRLDKGEMDLVSRMYETFEYLPIYVQDSSGVTIEEVKATAKAFKKKHGKLAVIAVDYLQIMKIPKQKGETRAETIGNVTREAKDIARKLDCCFIMLSQMTRDGDNGQRPTLGQLKESSSIEQDADMVEFLWRDPDKQNKTDVGKVITQTFAKGRDTGLNEFDLLFMGWKQKFQEMPESSS